MKRIYESNDEVWSANSAQDFDEDDERFSQITLYDGEDATTLEIYFDGGYGANVSVQNDFTKSRTWDLFQKLDYESLPKRLLKDWMKRKRNNPKYFPKAD